MKESVKKAITLALCIGSASGIANAATQSDPASLTRAQAGWTEMSKVTGARDRQVIAAPPCAAGGVPSAEVSLDKPVGAPVARDINYVLTKDNAGWRLLILRAKTGERPADSKRLSATVTTYCAF